MNILILGSKGMLGTDLVKLFPGATAWDIGEIDITNKDQVLSKITALNPDIVINAAAYTAVDDAETNKEKAMAVNSKALDHISKACNECGAILVHYSTDYIFNGNEKKGYTEDAKPNPINVYGESKLVGEQNIQQIHYKHYIIRTAWLFGKHGKNFVDTIKKLASEKKEIQVVNDQTGSPTYTIDLAAKTKEIMKLPFGIYHITNSGVCTWYDFAREIVKLSGLNCKVLPTTSKTFKRAAKRPQYSILLNTKTTHMRPWQDALADYLGGNN